VRDRRYALLAALIAIAAFLPALWSGFVYDDHRFYEGNPHLSHASILWRAFADPVCQTADGTEAGLWRPLRTLSFAFDHALFGDSAVGPHAVNVLLHGAGAACLFALLRRLGAGAWAALAGAALYALHPAQAETVAWISSRGDLLAMAGVLGALVAAHDERPRTALALGTAALLAKEQAVVWPALAFVAARMSGRTLSESARRALAPAIAVVVFVGIRHALLAEPTQQGGLGEGHAGLRDLAAMFGHQAWYAVFPVGTLFDWQMPAHELPLPAAIVFIAASAAAVWRPTRLPVLWFAVALVPTLFIQAFMPLNILVADRFLLFALPALAIGGARAWDRGAAAPVVAGVLCLGALTEAQIPVWRSDVTLWTRTADRVPGHPRANHWLGLESLRAGDLTDAVERLHVAAEADPGSAKTRFHYASALERQGKTTNDPAMLMDACAEYQQAAALCADPRAEGAPEIRPLALVAAVFTAVVGGEDEIGAGGVRRLLAVPRPPVPERVRDAWESRIESLALAAEVHALLGKDVAAQVREWGRLP
jgi:tetratricopeptide (TPR) repeat protein